MKPNTKKAIIIVVAVLAVAAFVWLVFFRKKGWEKVIDGLDLSSEDKKILKKQVEAIISDSAFDKSYYEAAAWRDKVTYDQYLVLEAAFFLGWPCGKNSDGSIVVNKPNN